MSIQEVIDQHKKHMERVCNLYQERVTSIKTVLFLIVASVTVPTKWRAYQHKIMTTTAATDENQEKTIQNKLKVLQLTNDNTNKITGSKLMKPTLKTTEVYAEQRGGIPQNTSNCTRP